MDLSRVLARATALATKQSAALKSIAKATAYLSSGGWYEDASTPRNWSQDACGRSLPYLVPTRSLSSGQEYRERATLYLQKASYELNAEGKIPSYGLTAFLYLEMVQFKAQHVVSLASAAMWMVIISFRLVKYRIYCSR
jgi:hypothetical protein